MDPTEIVMWLVLMIVAITIHEFAHAISADLLGDPTPRSEGRISLNPVDHFDPVGAVFMVISSIRGLGFAWGKPVMTNPRNFKHPLRDMMIVAACGPLSNLLQALVFAGVIHLNDKFGWWNDGGLTDEFLQYGIHVNIWLMLFNLIPVPPLDGSKVLYALLPSETAERYEKTMRQFGFIIFIMLMLTPLAGLIVGPEEYKIFHFLADQR